MRPETHGLPREELAPLSDQADLGGASKRSVALRVCLETYP